MDQGFLRGRVDRGREHDTAHASEDPRLPRYIRETTTAQARYGCPEGCNP
jgi:hypothetical protein